MVDDPKYQQIAEALISIPRYLSQSKIRLLGVEGVAAVVEEIAGSPDEHTSKLSDEPGGDKCPVCGKVKHQIYFNGSQPSKAGAPHVCRYCRWRIKTKADETCRERSGAPPKPPNASVEEAGTLSAAEIEALDDFIAKQQAQSSSGLMSRVELPLETSQLGGFYGPGYANLETGWYSTTEEEPNGPERREILSWWSAEHDAIVEWHLGIYRMFALAAARSVELEIMRRRGIKDRIARYFEYFVLARIRTQTRLWNIYASDLVARGHMFQRCRACGKDEKLVELHPDNVLATHGRLLPLCDLHWKTYRRAAGDKALGALSVDAIPAELDAVLGTHRCPVCGRDHSWMDRTYTYTDHFYGIPGRYREICFDCYDSATNKNIRRRPTAMDRKGLKEISKIVGALPSEDPFKVVTDQAQTLDAAAQVVRIMKDMTRFEAMKRADGSWFAVLVRSGCLPEGSRKEVYGTRILASDGHECLSMAEMQIDDLLAKLRIAHRKEVQYPDSSFRCDWVVQQGESVVFIEYFGLSGRADYDEKIVKKREMLKKAGVALIELYGEDLPRLSDRLAQLSSVSATRG